MDEVCSVKSMSDFQDVRRQWFYKLLASTFALRCRHFIDFDEDFFLGRFGD